MGYFIVVISISSGPNYGRYYWTGESWTTIKRNAKHYVNRCDAKKVIADSHDSLHIHYLVNKVK